MKQARAMAVAVASMIFLGSGCEVAPKAGPHDRSDAPLGAPADLVILNARIWTGADDGFEPTAIAVCDGVIAYVGRDSTARSLVGPSTKVIDAQGRRMIPGITDSHMHIVGGGLQLGRLALRDVRDRAEFVSAVAAAVGAVKPGGWLLGGRWSVDSWADPSPPNKAWIDPVTGNVPVLLGRMDGHQALANSAALRMAGIDSAGPVDPKGGEIERDSATGEPTGILKESAMTLVSRLIAPVSPDDRYEALLRAMQHAGAHGITSVHDMSNLGDLPLFRKAVERGEATVRITSYLSANWEAQMHRVADLDNAGDMHRVAGLKGFMDGSLGSRTAYMREPYADATPDTLYPRGQLTGFADPLESFEKRILDAHELGLQCAIHAIGTEGNHLLLSAYEAAGRVAGRRHSLHRVEHAQHLHVTDIPRFGQLGVVASMQPFHKADDGRYAEKALGPDRLAGSYAFRQLLDSGALLCFGSDWPVVTLNPFAGVESAVGTRTLAGDVWLPTHSLTVEEAIRAYTVSPPRAIHQGDKLGTLEPGKWADMVILDADPFTIPVERISEVRPTHTIVAGKVVFAR